MPAQTRQAFSAKGSATRGRLSDRHRQGWWTFLIDRPFAENLSSPDFRVFHHYPDKGAIPAMLALNVHGLAEVDRGSTEYSSQLDPTAVQ